MNFGRHPSPPPSPDKTKTPPWCTLTEEIKQRFILREGIQQAFTGGGYVILVPGYLLLNVCYINVCRSDVMLRQVLGIFIFATIGLILICAYPMRCFRRAVELFVVTITSYHRMGGRRRNVRHHRGNFVPIFSWQQLTILITWAPSSWELPATHCFYFLCQ